LCFILFCFVLILLCFFSCWFVLFLSCVFHRTRTRRRQHINERALMQRRPSSGVWHRRNEAASRVRRVAR
jgi:hypothetical protein